MPNRPYRLKQDKIDARDKLFHLFFPWEKPLPQSVDLRNNCSPIVNQGKLASCTANAIASGLREYFEVCSGNLTRLSRLWLYWKERDLEGIVEEDAGASIRDGMKILHKIGCPPETDWPYDISRFAETPPLSAANHADPFRISEYHRVSGLHALKTALAHGYPTVLGIKIYESFESAQVARTGVVPLPGKQEKYLGGHAVLAVGYLDDPKTAENGMVICRNSWGENWGDRGYFYLPYSFFEENVLDMWTGK